MATGDPTGIFRRHLPAIMHYIEEYRTLRAQAGRELLEAPGGLVRSPAPALDGGA